VNGFAARVWLTGERQTVYPLRSGVNRQLVVKGPVLLLDWFLPTGPADLRSAAE
jgi:hypothetical protein